MNEYMYVVADTFNWIDRFSSQTHDQNRREFENEQKKERSAWFDYFFPINGLRSRPQTVHVFLMKRNKTLNNNYVVTRRFLWFDLYSLVAANIFNFVLFFLASSIIMKTTHKTMTWIHECTHARNAVNFPSHNTRQSECGKRFLNYILRFPHDSEFLITICHMISKHKQNGRLNVFFVLFCFEFTCTHIKVKLSWQKNGWSCRNGLDVISTK